MRIIILFVKQEILGLNITMANSILVQVTESIESLFHNARSLTFCQMLLLRDVIEEFSTLAESTKNKGSKGVVKLTQ
tara:strand:+ start:1111 stop:1341 length:231 start_codon:yes stop_codon:yes gene_type:complete